MKEYRSMLRVPFRFSDPNAGQQLIDSLKCGAFDSVAFFNTSTHDIICEEKHREQKNALKPLVEAVKELGIGVGVDILSTVGHHLEMPDPLMDGMDFLVHGDGNKNRGVMCPTSEKTLDAIGRQYTAYAELPVDFIFVDDDMDYHCECFCDHCLMEFENRYGIFNEHGLSVSRENIIKLLKSEDITVRRKTREKWLDFYVYRANRIFAVIEKAVHAVNTSVVLGLMPCEVGSNGCGQDIWAETLSAGSKFILCRPGGGLYTDFRPNRALEKAHKLARELRYVPQYAVALSEIENYPQQALRKSARFTAFEAMLYAAVGCTGTSFNILPDSPVWIEEATPFYAVAKNVKPFVELIADNFGCNGANGIGCYWDKNTFAAPSLAEKVLPFEDEFYQIGLPVCYEPERTNVFIVNALSASDMTDNRIKNVLSHGVYIDADALDVLWARGFGKYLGFKKENAFFGNAVESAVKHSLNPYEGILRNAHLEFGMYGHSEFDRTGPAYSLLATDESAEELTVVLNYQGERQGIASGIFINELGGRICAVGYSPFSWNFSLGRTIQLKNIFRWLSGNTLSAFVASHNKIALWQRDTVDGKHGAIVANISLDDASGAAVMISGQFKDAKYVVCDGVTIHDYAVKCNRKNSYAEVILPNLPPLSVGIILPRE